MSDYILVLDATNRFGFVIEVGIPSRVRPWHLRLRFRGKSHRGPFQVPEISYDWIYGLLRRPLSRPHARIMDQREKNVLTIALKHTRCFPLLMCYCTDIFPCKSSANSLLHLCIAMFSWVESTIALIHTHVFMARKQIRVIRYQI